MRYLLFGLLLLICSCTKSEDASVLTTYTYLNNTNYSIGINIYRKSNEVIKFSYPIAAHDSLSLDYRSVGGNASPFGAPEVDSAEIIFDGGKKIIYTLTGPNGKDKNRNIFYINDQAYSVQKPDSKTYRFRYEFTNTDYFNAY